MGRFGGGCKGSRSQERRFGADDAFSAHLCGPLTGKTAGWKLRAFL
jgi:hypothetical protein